MTEQKVSTSTLLKTIGNVISNRYEFILLFEVINGNPNGDPDAENAPRIDPETFLGYVTDVCLKRKIRDYVDLVKAGEAGYNICVKSGRSLNSRFQEAYEEANKGLAAKDKKAKKGEAEERARDYMCANYYDVRMFGQVMNTGNNPIGIVRGPVQFTFANSISPIQPQEICITRQAITKDEDLERKETEMGKKNFIPYGLYRAEGFISAALAQKTTKITEEDVELLWEAMLNMFEHDHSAARGKMAVRGLYVFKHDSELGNCRAADLFDKIKIEQKNETVPPRSFDDYTISIDTDMPEGVTLIKKL